MNKKPLFVKLFISLAFILIAPVIVINTISNYWILHYSEDEISKNSIEKLKVAENISEQLSDAVSEDAVRISVNSLVNQLGSNKTLDISVNREDMIKAAQIVDILLEMVRTNNGYHSIYLYLEDLGYTFTSNNGLILNKDLKDAVWIDYYKKSMENETRFYWFKSKVTDDTIGINKMNTIPDEDVLTYIYPLTPYTTNLKGAIVVNLKWDFFNKLINNSDPESVGYINIISNNIDFVSSIKDDSFNKTPLNEEYTKSIINAIDKNGYIVGKINGEKSLISYHKSDFNNWIYVGEFSLENLTKRVNSIRWNTIYISLFIVCFGILISFLISNKLYNPVKKLVQNIKSEKGIEIACGDDEMHIINKAFNDILKQEKQLFNVIEENRKRLRKTILLNLLKGNLAYNIDEPELEMPFLLPNFICVIFSIDNYMEFKKCFDEEQQYYMKEFVLKIAEETLNCTYICQGVNMEEKEIALIINTNEKKCYDIQEELQENLIKFKKEIAKVLDYSISIGVGAPHSKKEEIKNSYIEAQEALKYKIKKGKGRIIFWTEDLTKQKYFYPFDTEKYILNYLNLGDKNEINNILVKLTYRIIEKDNLSYDNIMQIFNQLVGNTIIKYLVDSHINMNDIFENGFNIYLELSAKETLEEIESWLIKIYEKIIDYNMTKEECDVDNFSRILEYIHKNFKVDIGISNIAENVGLSYPHVRKIFKDETGENIVDYINNLRISEAKKLLKNTNICINEIALNVGYNNDQSFTRFFKKYEGVTPGEYRSKLSVSL